MKMFLRQEIFNTITKDSINKVYQDFSQISILTTKFLFSLMLIIYQMENDYKKAKVFANTKDVLNYIK